MEFSGMSGNEKKKSHVRDTAKIESGKLFIGRKDKQLKLTTRSQTRVQRQFTNRNRSESSLEFLLIFPGKVITCFGAC